MEESLDIVSYLKLIQLLQCRRIKYCRVVSVPASQQGGHGSDPQAGRLTTFLRGGCMISPSSSHCPKKCLPNISPQWALIPIFKLHYYHYIHLNFNYIVSIEGYWRKIFSYRLYASEMTCWTFLSVKTQCVQFSPWIRVSTIDEHNMSHYFGPKVLRLQIIISRCDTICFFGSNHILFCITKWTVIHSV